MSREYVEPTIEKVDSPVNDTVEKHPAYAQICASRVSGGAFLYGSDFAHQHYVTISIHASELHRGLSNDRPFARKEYIEVALSEAQWAAFVSSMNVGMGVQCTLNHLAGEMIPQIPSVKNRQAQFKADGSEDLASAVAELKALRKGIEQCSLSQKAKKDLLWNIEKIERGMGSSVEFVAKQFGEHIETVTEHAKIEINAYIQSTILRAGLTALQAPSPISLPGDSDAATTNGNDQ